MRRLCIAALISIFSSLSNAWTCTVCGFSFESQCAHNCKPLERKVEECEPCFDAEYLQRFTEDLGCSRLTLPPSSICNAMKCISSFLSQSSQKKDMGVAPFHWFYHLMEKLKLYVEDRSPSDPLLTSRGNEFLEGTKICSQDQMLIERLNVKPDLTPWANERYPFKIYDWMAYEANLCICSDEGVEVDDALCKLIYESLLYFSDKTELGDPVHDFPINQVEIKTCFISWLKCLGLISNDKFMTLTTRGSQIFRMLRDGYPNYQNGADQSKYYPENRDDGYSDSD